MKKKKNTRFLNEQNKGKPDAHKNSRKRAIGIIALVVVLAIGAGVWWFLDYTKDDGLIYPNVFVFGTDLGGMTPEDATATLRLINADSYLSKSMTVNLPDRVLTLTPEQTGVQLDVDGLVKICYDYGREGNRWQNTQAKKHAMHFSFEPDISQVLTVDRDSTLTLLHEAAAAAKSTLTQPQVTVTGETPDLNLTYEKALEKTDVTHKQLTIVLGTPERSLNTDALMKTILDAYYANDFTPIDFAYDVTEPDQPDLDAIHLEHTIVPVDAVLDETDYSISHEVLGYSFDLEELKQMVAEAGEGQTVTITFRYTPAAVTWAAIDATLFKDVLGSVSTNHTNDSNRNTNLKLACKAINGKLIRPGETFSYNQTLGERTEKKGYKPAGAYMAGKTVQTVGGGICQVSSTLYYACLKADLEIVDRTAHGYTVSYMPYGMDATVSWGALDYKFKNNTDYPIRIEAWVSGGQVHVKLIGTDTKDYYVKMTYETVEGPIEGKVVYEDYKWDNKEGYKDGEVLQTAYTGRTVKSYRQKFDKATDKLISSEYEATSRYKSRDKIIARVEPKPVPPTEPATEPTTAPAETTAP